MNSKELMKEIEKNKKPISEYDARDHILNEICRLSLCFNVTDITKILAELISNKEEESYIPLIFEVNDVKCNKVIFAISKSNSEEVSNDENNQKLIHIDSISRNDDDLEVDEPYKKNITFKHLWQNYRVRGLDEITRLCNNDFSNYEYVNKFLEYLFDLQVQNNGKHLTYEEMQAALNKFSELERNKPKQKIKQRNNES